MKDFVCNNSDVDNFGYHVLYDAMEQSELPEGSTVVSCIGKRLIMFQTKDTVDVFDDDFVSNIVGSATILDTDKGFVPPNKVAFSAEISTLRFPTKDELEWYNKIDTI